MLNYTGIEASDYTIIWQTNAQLDGASITSWRVEPRPIYLFAECRQPDDKGATRDVLVRFFAPKKTGTLVVTLGNIRRKIQYTVESFRIRQDNLYEPLRWELDIMCPNPYMLDINTYYRNMAGVAGKFYFPLAIPPSGFVASVREMQQEAAIQNPGDTEVGLKIKFIAKRGSVVNPKIINLSSGDYFRVVKTMNRGDVLTVTTVAGSKRVELNGVNAIQYIDRESAFFWLAPGENILKYDADDGYSNLDVYPTFTPEYLGI